MNILRVRYFPGPNVHAGVPVIEGTVSPGPDASTAIPRVFRAVGGDSPGILSDLPTAFAEVVVRLQTRAGVPAAFATGAGDTFAAECPFEAVGRAAVEIAARLFADAGTGDVTVSPDELKRLADLEYAERLPATTAVIYQAARRRNIPSRRLSSEYGRLLIHGQGSKQHRSLAAEPDSVGVVARTVSTDKQLAKELMAAVGVPVPVGRAVTTLGDAIRAAEELGFPVAVKPQDSDLQIGVTLDIRTPEQVEAAFPAAFAPSGCVLVERFAPGVEHRVLVVDGKVAAVTRIDPPQVRGDGVRTVAELVADVNSDPRRGDEGSDLPWHKLVLDDEALGVLAAQGFDASAVPPAGAKVLVRRNPPYFKHGGNFVDQTDDIHPATAAHAAAAADAVQLRVAGLDIVARDIREPLEPQGGVVVEINAGPGLWLHLAPWADSPRPVGDAIVASMFPPGESGRVPVVAVVSEVPGEAAAVAGFVREILARDGRRVGVAGPAELSVGGRTWPAPASPHARATRLLQSTSVDVAVLETSPAELLDSGFGTDRCDIAVSLVPAAADATYLRVLRHALAPGGTLITDADPAAAAAAVARGLGVPDATLTEFTSRTGR